MEFLVRSGLPESNKETVLIKQNGHVTIKDLDNNVCKSMIESIHNKKYFDRKLFCNGFIALSPEKPVKDSTTQGPVPPHKVADSTSSTSRTSSTATTENTITTPIVSHTLPSYTAQLPQLVLPVPVSPFSSSPSKLQDIGPHSIIPETPIQTCHSLLTWIF